MVSIFGKSKLPAIGFGKGDVTLKNFLETYDLFPKERSKTQVLITMFDEESKFASFKLADKLRKLGINSEIYPTPEKLGKQFKYADKKKIKFVIVQGPDELAQNKINLKNMETGEEKLVKINQILNEVR